MWKKIELHLKKKTLEKYTININKYNIKFM